MTPPASEKCGLLSSDQHCLASCTSNGINAEQASGLFSVLTISSLSAHASALSEERGLERFQNSRHSKRIGISDGEVKAKIGRIKRGGRHMKAAHFLLAILMLVGLLLSAGPAAAFSDTNAHAYTSSTCGTHVPSVISGRNGYIFYFCRAGSAATSWKAEILNSSNNPIPACTPAPSWANLPPNVRAITCSSLPLGTIKTKVSWYVGGSPLMEHPHNTFNQ